MPTALENINRAIELLEAHPEQALDLDTWQSDCGTIVCLGGLLASQPEFIAQGFQFRVIKVNGRRMVGDDSLERSDELFGCSEYCLFQPADLGWWDDDIMCERFGKPSQETTYENWRYLMRLVCDTARERQERIPGYSDKWLAMQRLLKARERVLAEQAAT